MAVSIITFVIPTVFAQAQSPEEYLELWETRNLDALIPLVEKGKKLGSTEAWYIDGHLAMLEYDFARAAKSYAEFNRLSKKNPLDDSFMAAPADYTAEIKEARQQFDRFQEIAVIDAIKVPRIDFYKQMRLPLSAGRITDYADAGLDYNECWGPVYISEGGDLLMYSSFTDSDELAIGEVNILADGSKSEFKEAEGLGDNPAYPFLSADGTTLYFSSTGPNSMGGRDIFITTRDPQTGEYRAPVNAGMPFNSAADDYMMAIDEENGVGWWATDARFLPDDEIMLYVYVLPEGRKNFTGTAEEKKERGLLADYRVTWQSDEDAAEEDVNENDGDKDAEVDDENLTETYEQRAARYERLAADIRKIEPGQKPRRHECRIPLPGLKYIYSADDVKTREQKHIVEQYIKAEKQQQDLEQRLDAQRRKYAKTPSAALANEIKNLEQECIEGDRKLEMILSSLYRMM